MSKTCKNLEEAYKTQEHYQNTRGVESFIEKSEDELLVYRKSDGKVLKSINYSPPDIEKMLYGSKK
jgi:hypothetical protein